MQILSAEILNEYKEKNLLYRIFHSFHPITESQSLVYKMQNINPKEKQHTTTQAVQQTQAPQITNSASPDEPQQTSQVQQTQQTVASVMPQVFEDIKATDRTPQNPVVFNTSNNPSTPEETIPSEPQKTQPYHEENLPNRHEQATNNQQNLGPNTRATTPTVEQNIQNTTSQQTQVSRRVTVTKPQQPQYHGNRFNPNTNAVTQTPQTHSESVTVNKVSAQPKTTSVPVTQQYVQRNSPKEEQVQQTSQIQRTMTTRTQSDINAEAYKIINRAASQLDWIKKVNSFELASKQELQSMPIPALRVFDIKDNQEMILPLNDGTILHDIYSITITKDLCLMLLFRNNSAIYIAPETLANNNQNRELLIKKGFNYFYKNYGLDIQKLIESLKMISVTSTSTPEFTQFILKTMPFIKG